MSNRKDMAVAYNAALALPGNSAAHKLDEARLEAKKAALDRAHEMRKFEIENYWKRATYFWSFQAIAFVVLGFVLKDGKLPEDLRILQLPAAIGAISGFVGWLSAKGSKFWQENWEAHVDMLEQDLEGRLTQTIWSDGRKSHSVSRLNQTFIAILTTGWVCVMTIPFIDTLPQWIVHLSPLLLFGLLIVTLAGIWVGTKQKFVGYVVHNDAWIQKNSGFRWSWKRTGDGTENRALLLRHTAAKDAKNPE